MTLGGWMSCRKQDEQFDNCIYFTLSSDERWEQSITQGPSMAQHLFHTLGATAELLGMTVVQRTADTWCDKWVWKSSSPQKRKCLSLYAYLTWVWFNVHKTNSCLWQVYVACVHLPFLCDFFQIIGTIPLMPNPVPSSQAAGGAQGLQVQPITPQLLTNAQGQIIATVIGNQILPVINTQGITLSPLKPGQQVTCL